MFYELFCLHVGDQVLNDTMFAYTNISKRLYSILVHRLLYAIQYVSFAAQ